MKLSSALPPAIRPTLHAVWNSPPLWRIRGAFFNVQESLNGYQYEKKKFFKKHGYELDLEHPKSYSQKLIWKKIHDRNPLIPQTADKYGVREYVKETLGEKKAEDILVPLYYVTDNPATIPFDKLPEEYIIKATHDSGGFVIVRKGETVDREAIIKRMRWLLRQPYGLFKKEWSYWTIKPQVIVEKLLRGDDGDLAQDYKFHVFNGVCQFIHTTPKVNSVRTGKRSLFTRDWTYLPVGFKYPAGPAVEPPVCLPEMVRLAEKLATQFDYARVDFYCAKGHIYFGEITHYHGSGMDKLTPTSFDFEIGETWKLVPDYWRKSTA